MLWYPFWPKFKLTHPIFSVVHPPKMAPAMKAMKKAVGATGLTVSAAFTKAVESTELKQHAANKQFWKEYSACANALHRANAVLKKHAHDEKHTSLMQTAQVLLSERPKMPAN